MIDIDDDINLDDIWDEIDDIWLIFGVKLMIYTCVVICIINEIDDNYTSLIIRQ